MNLFRNKEIKIFLLNYLLLAIGASVAASFISVWAVILVVSTCVISALLFILFTRKRYQAISDLNAQIDSILHGEYNINLIPDEEGELAVLCSELSKMTFGDSNYTLVKYSSTYKERKAQGEVVDYWYRLTLTKAFTDEKEPDRDVQITYGV